MTSDHAGPLAHRARIDGVGRALTALLAMTLAACSDARTDNIPETSANAETAAADARAPADQNASFEISGTSYPFRVLRCDLTGQLYDGMILQGAGITPDGRSIAVSIDRTGSDLITENAFISIGPRDGGDRWSAIRTGLQDGRWFADEGATEPADGPLIETSGSALSVESSFTRQNDNTSERGVLRATCPS